MPAPPTGARSAHAVEEGVEQVAPAAGERVARRRPPPAPWPKTPSCAEPVVAGPALGVLQHLVGQADLLELLAGVGVVLVGVGVELAGLGPVGPLQLVVGGVAAGRPAPRRGRRRSRTGLRSLIGRPRSGAHPGGRPPPGRRPAPARSACGLARALRPCRPASPSTDRGRPRWRTRPGHKPVLGADGDRQPDVEDVAEHVTTTNCCSRMVRTERTVSTASKAAAVRDEPPTKSWSPASATPKDRRATTPARTTLSVVGSPVGPPWPAPWTRDAEGMGGQPGAGLGQPASSASSSSSMDCFCTAPSDSTTTRRARRGPGPPAAPSGWRPSRGGTDHHGRAVGQVGQQPRGALEHLLDLAVGWSKNWRTC